MNNEFTVAILDDEKDIRLLFKEVLEDEGYQTVGAKNSEELYKLIEMYNIRLIFLDIVLDMEDGIDILQNLKQHYPDIEVIMITGHGTIDLAVKATKLGAFDFMSKPVTVDYIIQAVRKVKYVESLKEENKVLKEKSFIQDELIGEDEKIMKIKELIKVISKSDSKVLIHGENGTGKELLARMIHFNSSRANEKFIEINCAAIPSTLIESELFGFEKGSFTNAFEQKQGKFEIANKGTLFLDEIGDMSMETQVKLLRVIQDGRFTRIGGLDTIEVDVRIISATNKVLEEEIQNGKFREDLYYRLNVIPVYLPPLRERKKDIGLLIDYFIRNIKSQGNLRFETLEKGAYKMLEDYKWPGNIREMKNIIERINILSDSKNISESFIAGILKSDMSQLSAKKSVDQEATLEVLKADFEKNIIEERLKKFNYNMTSTAKSLGIERSNLYRKIKKLDIQDIKND